MTPLPQELKELMEREALEFFKANVTYIEEEQARKMATENRSLTYRAVLHGGQKCFEAMSAEVQQIRKESREILSNKTIHLEAENTALRSRIERLESFEHWSHMTRLMLDFDSLSDKNKELVMLCADGCKYRAGLKESEGGV